MTVTLHGPDGAGQRRADDPEAQPALRPETPSEAIINAANQTREVTDARGRVLAFKKLGALAAMDLNEIAGAANAINPGWMVYATIAFSVVSIDGKRVPRPTSKAALRALVERLGDDGIDAIYAVAVPKEAEPPADDDEGRTPPDDLRDRAKN